MNGILITNIGLILDIIGAILIYKYGLPSVETRNTSFLVFESTTDKQKKQNERAKINSHYGLIFLIAGFVLQLMGNIFNH